MNQNLENSDKKEITLQEIISDYTRFWYLFVIGIAIAVVVAYTILRYATPVYETQTTIIVKDERSGGGAVELAAFSELPFFANSFSSKKMVSEIVIIKSRNIISKTLKALDLNIVYNVEGTIKGTELYGYKPIKVNFIDSKNDKNLAVPKITISILDKIKFKLTIAEELDSKTYSFGDVLKFPFSEIVVLPNFEDEEKYSIYLNRPIHVQYYPIEKVARLYQGKIEAIHDGKNGDVLQLKIKSTLPEKAEDFLDELVYQYNQDAIYDKNQIALKTSQFIKSRLEIITKELDSVENNKELFKSRNRLTDIESESNLMMENASEFNKRQVDLSTQIQLSKSMVSYLESSSSTELIPTNVSLGKNEVALSINTFNQLVLERNKLLENSTPKNPVIRNIDGQLKHLHISILKSTKTQQDRLQLILKDLNVEENKFNSKLSQVPKKEKLFRGIVRQQNIKEQLYLFLLRQREEISISLAVTSPKAKIVDKAISSNTPVSPKKGIILLVSILLGLLIPFIIIYLKYLLDTKINNRRDIERIVGNIPVVGEIPRLGKNDKQLIAINDRSLLAESFRILRTNLQYLFINAEKENNSSKTIFVTSTVHSEGKTFVTFNLALSLASINKKVILVGADIRNPQLHRYFADGDKNQEGLTDYIVRDNLSINSIVKKSEFHPNLDILLSGAIPPNPTELLMMPKIKIFFQELQEQYDYVIVDTAPSMLVADTILINKYADVTLYVTRASYTDKKLLDFLTDSVKDKKLKNVGVVINYVDTANYGYGNKYGYTYGERKKSKVKSFLDSI
ncbi:MAG: polysaccharide biosynthesis tyrosine autokinase [Flavobacteriaceae bacterium]|nr:polysaccharide biosynthesis tyrosine autokinase [Flavobacteriaceae bacterium]